MTVKTLSYIHKLLVLKEENYLSMYNDARKAQYDAEDAQSPDAEQKKRTADTFWEMLSESSDALQDFENQDWR